MRVVPWCTSPRDSRATVSSLRPPSAKLSPTWLCKARPRRPSHSCGWGIVLEGNAEMLATLREQFLDEGYCRIEGVIPPEEIASVSASVERDVLAHTCLPLPSGYVPGLLRFNQALAPY